MFLVIMSGMPYAGKTYLSKSIASALGFERVSHDDIWEEMNRADNKWPSFEQTDKVARQRIADSLDQGIPVVADQLGEVRWYRDELKELALGHGAKPVLVYVNTPLDIRKERQERNRLSGELHHVSKKRFFAWQDTFETPMRDEQLIIFTPQNDTSEWIARLEHLLGTSFP